MRSHTTGKALTAEKQWRNRFPSLPLRICGQCENPLLTTSGLSWEPRSRAVEQVHLRCTEGSLEWMYPARALRVVLEPNLSSARHTTVCIKPASDFQGASIYVERAGQLHLVVSEAEGAQPHHVSCFSAHTPRRVALFLQASPQRDISRRMASFQYELLSNQSAASPDFKKMALVEAMCRPCDNMELLMAICSSDFVVKGSIRNVSHDSENHMSQVDVSVHKVYRQKNRIFQQDEASGEWRGPIRTLLQCKVKKGGGDFLFTGNEHFGEAWLGCAPRFKDFMFIYWAARERGANPCEFQLN
ncbi:meteorin-like protein isoform X2 [Pezoporus flaviventris]|uniref:meteorin-like protein isoform X2 n=1 Tax=Pezoporus flaviventris TaxID=889875 RepID=UPI002AB173EE|nr:meteorin-like protein isoform X2 [Pezoporus flaviventris]